MKEKDLLVYLCIAFVGAWLLQLIGIFVFPSLLNLFIPISMFMPLLGVWIIKNRSWKEMKETISFSFSWKKSWKYLCFALLGPFLFTALGIVLYFLIFPNQYDPQFGALKQIIGVAEVPFSLTSFLISQILLSVTIAPLMNSVLAIGEEVGWRGYLTPRLTQLYGKKGYLYSGVIWGLWHALLIVLTGYEYGVGYFGFPITGILLMCVFTTVFGILLSWLYEKSGSILIPSIAHGAINAVAALGLYFLHELPTQYILGPVLPGLIPLIPMAIVAVLVSRFLKGGEYGK